jgi:glycosyltransferase involved in cell wall biosynthesis
MPYRFQVVGLPHTSTSIEYNNCAFATLTRKFCAMMKSLGHEVIVYSGDDNDAPCDEHVTCITKAEQATLMNVRGPEDILKEPFVHQTYLPQSPWWAYWNQQVINAMEPRAQHKDFLCIIGGGVLFEPLISTMMNRMIPVEYAIGYAGVSANSWHCFGSSNWQHVVFGLNRYENWRGRFYDRCIPHYFDPDDFEFRVEKSDYMLYLGKIKEDKGVNVAARAAKATGNRLIVAGQGPTPVEYGEVRNRYIDADERRELLAGARAVFVPSLYVEPFGMIAVEALMSGTPIITTPWGGLGEINIDGVTGYKCNTLQDFVDAANNIANINPQDCRDRGMCYSMDIIRHQYQRWFDDLYGLWNPEGWGVLKD